MGLQVSVGDWQVVVQAPPWPWWVDEHDPAYATTGVRDKPRYIRPPRYMPVHCTIPSLTRHPVTGDIALAYTPYFDAGSEYPLGGICMSRDGGWTWSAPRLEQDLSFPSPHGRGWISVGYYTGYEPEHPNRCRLCVLRSDDGIVWTRDVPDAILSFPEGIEPQPAWKPDEAPEIYGGARSLRGLYPCPSTVTLHKKIEENGGALFMCGYGQLTRGGGSRNFLIKSDDSGKSWRFYADIGRDYEPDFCRLPNGDMIAVARCGGDEPRVLLQTRSIDDGITWSDPTPAPGVETVSREDRTWKDPQGDLFREASGGNVDPCLQPLENGIIALSYGRPALCLRFSEDGLGNSWDYRTELIPKYAMKDGRAWAFPEQSVISHYYSGMVALSPRTVLVASNIYGYSPSGDPDKGRDMIFVVPVSVRRDGEENRPPAIRGSREAVCAPGREVEVRFTLSDPDGDWVRLKCDGPPETEVRGNAVAFKAPWEFSGETSLTVSTEDAWGERSKDHPLMIRKG